MRKNFDEKNDKDNNYDEKNYDEKNYDEKHYEDNNDVDTDRNILVRMLCQCLWTAPSVFGLASLSSGRSTQIINLSIVIIITNYMNRFRAIPI